MNAPNCFDPPPRPKTDATDAPLYFGSPSPEDYPPMEPMQRRPDIDQADSLPPLAPHLKCETCGRVLGDEEIHARHDRLYCGECEAKRTKAMGS